MKAYEGNNSQEIKAAYENVIRTNVSRLAEIKRVIEKLKKEAAELEGYFLTLATGDLADTKYKSVKYTDGISKVTVTEATTLKVIYPSILKMVLGNAFDDVVKQETTYKISSAAATRLLAGIYSGNYDKSEPEEVIFAITDDEEKQNALAKKLKGANYESDKKAIISIVGCDEKRAEEFAYIFGEAMCWQNFQQLMKNSGTVCGNARALEGISAAVAVETIPKIKVEVGYGKDKSQTDA